MEFTQTPVFENGMAQPVFPYTSGKSADYNYETSAIVRYCVYIESDYDMDADGKRDLVKALIQVPRSAVEGAYKAAVLYEARPYCSGVNEDGYAHMKEVEAVDLEPYDLKSLDDPADPRIPTGNVTALEAAAMTKPSDWYFPYPGNHNTYYYESLDLYDYYLIRGFAIVLCSGFGTLSSGGFEYGGSHYERDAFKCVVEWLHGDRIAYVSPDSTLTVKADWCNGNVAMTGRSYAGTMPFAVAVTGVAGLKTIVPVAGIADWYSQQNMQGAQRYWPQEALNSFLAYYCTSKYYDPDLTPELKSKLDRFLNQYSHEQIRTGCDYSDFWNDGNYTLQAEGLRCSALIVHGLHDENVGTKQFEMMLHAFEKAGCTAKLLLHQGPHITPSMPNKHYGLDINGRFYDDIVNEWLCHYLYDLDNGAEDRPAVLMQSNVDQHQWFTAPSWETGKAITLEHPETGITLIDTDWAAAGVTPENYDLKMSTADSNMNHRYISPKLEAPLTLQGTLQVDLKAALNSGNAAAHFEPENPNDADQLTFSLPTACGIQDDIKLTLLLCDIADEPFTNISSSDPQRNIVPTKIAKAGGIPLGGELPALDLAEFDTVNTCFNVISRAYVDLCNPASGYDPTTASEAITLVPGEYHDYHVFLHPNRYTFLPGHHAALVITTEDPINCLSHKKYQVSLDNASVKITMPVSVL